MPMKRGALIVLEGLDRSGKSTQCKALVENLLKNQIAAEYMNFPTRTTETGKLINSYLTSNQELPDQAIHLLFSANRWERANEIRHKLEKGVSLVVDRYCYSGVAFSAAKGLPFHWCKGPDIGLPKPDIVFFLSMPLEKLHQRKGWGHERYESSLFQTKVFEQYMQLKDDTWEVLDASRSVQVIQEELLTKARDVIDNVGSKPIGKVFHEFD